MLVERQNLIVSFTSLPSRVGHIQGMVDSILTQTRKPDKFLLWLPEYCDREQGKYPDVRYTGVEIRKAKRDYGPATKLIPTLQEFFSEDDLLVSVDDDVSYDSHFLEELEAAIMKYPGFAWGFMGCSHGRPYHAEKINPSQDFLFVGLLGGYRGIGYRRDLFDDSIFGDIEWLLSDGPFVCDDQLFSWNLFRRGIPSAVVKTKYPGVNGSLNFRFLHLGNGIYDVQNKELAKQSIEKISFLYNENEWSLPP